MERKHRPTRTTSYKLTIAGLLTKRREVAGEAERARERLTELETAIGHLDAVLVLFGVDDAPKLKPLRRMNGPRLSRTASRDRQRAILRMLRDASDGMTTPVIAAAMADAFQSGTGRERTRADVVSEVRKVMHRLEAKGAVQRTERVGESRVWSIR